MRTPKAIAALRALCHLGLPVDVLVPAVLEALHQVVPSYRNLFDCTDEEGRLLRYFIEGPIDARLAQLYFDEFHNRREAEAMPRFDTLSRLPAGVRGVRDIVQERFYRSALYHEIWRPQGFHTRLEAVVRDRSGRLLGSLVLYRSAGEPAFKAHDELRLASVLPALADGLRHGGRVPPDDRHVPTPEPAETLLLTLQGSVCHASAGAHSLLLLAAGGASRELLSRPLHDLGSGVLSLLLARLRERAAAPPQAGGPGGSAAPLSITQSTASGQLFLQGTLLRPLHPPAEPLAQVSLRRLEPHRVALERALRAMSVTPGQMAVCRELYHGRTHAEIGVRLGVAPATVVDHVRKIYGALDLRSTLELRAALDARLSAAPMG